jgi:hypothetical protein
MSGGLFGDAAPVAFSKAQKLEAVERELKYRRRVYARRVADGQMTQDFADLQIALFESIALDYR